jgi:pyruvate formate lyase activating enzyme
MIKGFRGTSLVDYPGKIASVIFTYGCNFRCPYCYNLDLVLPERFNQLEDIPEEEVLKELERRKGFIKGVVITGGEPTIWERKLIAFIERIYFELQLPVKLDTNGSNPQIIKALTEMEIVDFWAIDFKTSPEKYKEVGGDFEKVEESLNILRNYPDKVEVRITCYPPLISEEELKEMIPYLKGFKFIALQKYVPEETLSGEKVEPYSEDFYNWAIDFLKQHLPEAEIVKRF